MKMPIFKFMIVVLCVSFITSNLDKKFMEMEGTATNYGDKNVEAINSSFAKTKDVILTNDPAYKTPDFVLKLPLRRPIETGPAETVEEVPSVIDYYDGQKGIKHSASFCQMFTTKPQACVHQGNCGWCMGEGSCISGGPKGPQNNKDCLRGKYVFEAPNADWNPITIPNTKLTRSNVLGAQLTTIVEQRP